MAKQPLGPADELKLVRKLLQKDYLVELAGVIAAARHTAVGVEVHGSPEVPNSLTSPTTVPWQGAPFDSSGFFQGHGSTSLVVPSHLGGRYHVVLGLRWTNLDPAFTWRLEHAHGGYFYARVLVNGSGAATNSLRTTANPTIGATGTTHNASWYLSLIPGDTVEVQVEQGVMDDGVKADVALCLMRHGSGS